MPDTTRPVKCHYLRVIRIWGLYYPPGHLKESRDHSQWCYYGSKTTSVLGRIHFRASFAVQHKQYRRFWLNLNSVSANDSVCLTTMNTPQCFQLGSWQEISYGPQEPHVIDTHSSWWNCQIDPMCLGRNRRFASVSWLCWYSHHVSHNLPDLAFSVIL